MNKKEISSGAEKAEELQNRGAETKKENKENKGASANKSTAAAKKSSAQTKKSSTNSAKNAKVNARTGKATPIKDNSESAVQVKHEERKIKNAELKAERKQKQLELKAERLKRKDEKRAVLKAKRKDRKIKSEKLSAQEKKEARLAKIEAKNAKRQAKLAEIRAKREHKLKVRAEKRANKKEREHAPGFGGWLAAVIALGITTLALGTMVTFGWISANGMRADMAGLQTQSVYELNGIFDDLDTNLSKARVANSSSDQTKLLADIAIESQTAETILERMPMECTFTQKMTSFVNGMGNEAKALLYKISAGENLSESDREIIENLYATNMKLKRSINEMTGKMNAKEIIAMIEGKTDCMIMKAFGDIENEIFGETEKNLQTTRSSNADSSKKSAPKYLENLDEITSSEATEIAKKHFKDYKVTDAKCTGEAISNGVELFNVTLTTDDCEMLAQLSKKGGKVVMFESYKDCSDKNFSVDRCIDIAEEFLETLGYDDLKPVWTSENGTVCNLTFVYEDDGIIYYTDKVLVKVCEQRGLVTGIEAYPYVANHRERGEMSAKISKGEAAKVISDRLKIKHTRLAVIPQSGNEVLTWEINAENGENEYFVYVDAQSGNELEVRTVVGTKQGRIIK